MTPVSHIVSSFSFFPERAKSNLPLGEKSPGSCCDQHQRRIARDSLADRPAPSEARKPTD